MLRRIIIGTVIVLVPIAFYIASRFGDVDEVNFEQAIETTITNLEGDQTPKVLVVTTITSTSAEGELFGQDGTGRRFRIDYTGSPPDQPFAEGQTVRFVGHVHMADEAYFHATQVYGQ